MPHLKSLFLPRVTMIPDPRLCYDKLWMTFWLIDKAFCKGCHLICMWLTVAMAAIRYVMVCHQRNFKFKFPNSRTYLIVAVTVVGCSLVAVPLYMDKQVVNLSDLFSNYSISNNSNNSNNSNYLNYPNNCYNADDSEFAKSNPFIKNYDFWFAGVAMQIIPSSLMSVFTLLLMRKIRRSVSFRKASTINMRASMEKVNSITDVHYVSTRKSSTSSNSYMGSIKKFSALRKQASVRDFVRTSKMLMMIVVCSIVSDIPLGVIVMIINYDKTWYFRYGQHLFNPCMLLSYINSSINIIFYCTMSRHFRGAAKEIFLPKKFYRDSNIGTAFL